VRGLPGCGAAVVLEAPGATVSGVCWFAKSAAGAASTVDERTLLVLARGNLRKQGTVTRREAGGAAPGVRYHKQADVGRHSLVRALTNDGDELGTLRDFASIRHPVLGDVSHGDAASNDFLDHRHGLDRAFVHCTASRLRVDATTTREATSELAPELSRVLASLASD